MMYVSMKMPTRVDKAAGPWRDSGTAQSSQTSASASVLTTARMSPHARQRERVLHSCARPKGVRRNHPLRFRYDFSVSDAARDERKDGIHHRVMNQHASCKQRARGGIQCESARLGVARVLESRSASEKWRTPRMMTGDGERIRGKMSKREEFSAVIERTRSGALAGGRSALCTHCAEV